MKPTKLLRHFFAGHPELLHLSTQRGLAQLADRSESLLRAVEGGGVKLSLKFARALSDKTGASKEWLLQESVSGTEVPDADGAPLRYETVIARIMGESAGLQPAKGLRPELTGKTGLMDSSLGTTPASVAGNSSAPMPRRMAVAMATFVEDALFETLSRGDTTLMDAISKLLARDISYADASSVRAAMTTTSAMPPPAVEDSGSPAESADEICLDATDCGKKTDRCFSRKDEDDDVITA